jgi:uncharacterized protein YjbJ (UPF0337 family)
MKRDRIKAHWMQFKGRAREQWGRLTGNDREIVAGRREQMLGRFEALYAAPRGTSGTSSSRTR